MIKFLKIVLLGCGIALGGFAHAQQRLEIIPLKHRLAEQVMPSLQPLVEPGGSISAASGKVIVRASPGNIEQIRQTLAAIDTPLRRLLITVNQGGDGSSASSNVGIQTGRVTIDQNGRISGDVRGQASSDSTQRSSQSTQRIQTIEGGEAAIFVGRSIALPMRQAVVGSQGAIVSETIQYVDVGSGFFARPDVVGDRVTITISPRSERLSGRAIHGSRLSTTVNGRLGEWISLGGSSQQRDSQGRGLADYGSQRGSESTELMLRVELLE